jgi:Resolvase, N terminal domain
LQKPEFAGFIGPISERVQMGQAAIYCRISTDDQSGERQECDLRTFATRSGHHIVAMFKETASGAKNDRAERKKVIALAQARKIDVSSSPNCRDRAAAPRISSRHWMISAAGRSACPRRRA